MVTAACSNKQSIKGQRLRPIVITGKPRQNAEDEGGRIGPSPSSLMAWPAFSGPRDQI
jgi:hypothetical protein